MVQKIRAMISQEELLAGLAEEATEMAQAALKCRRTLTQLNPTPVKFPDAAQSLMEEIADVLLYLDVLGVGLSDVAGTMDRKLSRWVQRLEAMHES